jgi:hypothetical protein
MSDFFRSGDWNAICDSCGKKLKASTLRKRWDGFMVCAKDWEPRHIADFIKAPHPERALPWTRPEAPDQTIVPAYVSTGTQDSTIPTAPTGNRGTL